MLSTLNSKSLFNRAITKIPGGVNSPIRSMKNLRDNPIFIKKSCGPYLFDVDNNKYIDYVGAFGPTILGHNHPNVIEAITQTINNGLSFGAPTEIEVEIAELICKIMPNIEMIRMVNSGTEATLAAIRLARGYTKRNKIIKFSGCYHGHSDSLLVNSSEGIPENIQQDTLIAPYNNPEYIAELFNKNKNEIAAIIVEPVAGNMNLVLPKKNFLYDLRKLCDNNNSLLIFDEVMTGFRVALGGAQEFYNIKPDLTCLGKVIGGGLPVGAFGGKKEIMQKLAPLGPVYQAGTMSGNPVTMAAGLATLKELIKPGVYKTLSQNCQRLANSIKHISNEFNINIETNHIGAMFGFKFIDDHDDYKFKTFFNAALENGIFFPPASSEAGFISITHDEKILSETSDKLKNIFKFISVTENKIKENLYQTS